MIQIDLCRVTSNGKFIDLIIECADGYYFDGLQVSQFGGEVYVYDSVFYEDHFVRKDKREWKLRVPTSHFTGDYPMYGITLTVKPLDEELAELASCKSLSKSAACSDISTVYQFILNALLGLCCERCNIEIPVEIQRTFTMIYAHLQAMKIGDYDNAFTFFKAIYSNFNNCPSGCKTGYNNQSGLPTGGCGCKH